MTNEIIGQGWSFPLCINARGVLALTSGHSEIEQAIGIILATPVGRRVMRPTFGSRLHELVFAPNNSYTAAQVRRMVEEALGMWEPRINVIDIDVRPHGDEAQCLLIEVTYEIKATHDRRSLVYPFYLIPME